MFRHVAAGTATPPKERHYSDSGTASLPRLRRDKSFIDSAAKSPFMRLANLVEQSSAYAETDYGDTGDRNEEAADTSLTLPFIHIYRGVPTQDEGSSVASPSAGLSTNVASARTCAPTSEMWWNDEVGSCRSNAETSGGSEFGGNSATPGEPSSPASPPPRSTHKRRGQNEKVSVKGAGVSLFGSSFWATTVQEHVVTQGVAPEQTSAAFAEAQAARARGQVGRLKKKRAGKLDPWDTSPPDPDTLGGKPEPFASVKRRARKWLLKKGVPASLSSLQPFQRVRASWSPQFLRVTSLHEASYEGDLALCRFLVGQAKSPWAANAAGQGARTNTDPPEQKVCVVGKWVGEPSQSVFVWGQGSGVGRMEASKALVRNCDNVLGDTPFHLACHKGHLKVAAFLVREGGGGASDLGGAWARGGGGARDLLRALNSQGKSAFVLACRAGHADLTRWLLVGGACNYYDFDEVAELKKQEAEEERRLQLEKDAMSGSRGSCKGGGGSKRGGSKGGGGGGGGSIGGSFDGGGSSDPVHVSKDPHFPLHVPVRRANPLGGGGDGSFSASSRAPRTMSRMESELDLGLDEEEDSRDHKQQQQQPGPASTEEDSKAERARGGPGHVSARVLNRAVAAVGPKAPGEGGDGSVRSKSGGGEEGGSVAASTKSTGEVEGGAAAAASAGGGGRKTAALLLNHRFSTHSHSDVPVRTQLALFCRQEVRRRDAVAALLLVATTRPHERAVARVRGQVRADAQAQEELELRQEMKLALGGQRHLHSQQEQQLVAQRHKPSELSTAVPKGKTTTWCYFSRIADICPPGMVGPPPAWEEARTESGSGNSSRSSSAGRASEPAALALTDGVRGGGGGGGETPPQKMKTAELRTALKALCGPDFNTQGLSKSQLVAKLVRVRSALEARQIAKSHETRTVTKRLIFDFAGLPRGRALRNLREAALILEAPFVEE